MLPRAAPALRRSFKLNSQYHLPLSFPLSAFASPSARATHSARSLVGGKGIQPGRRDISDAADGRGERLERYMRARRKNNMKYLVCNNCRREGHKGVDCPHPKKCIACGGEGHERKDCPNPDPAWLAAYAAEARPPTCFRCGEEGHRITECTLPPACYGCGRMGHRHEDCPTDPCPPSAPRPPKGDFLVCKNCRREGHSEGHCPKPLQCRACGGEGHPQKDCPNPDPARLEALKTPKLPICFRCGEEGHSITECTQPRPCYGCGKPGHQQDDCPTKHLAIRVRRASQAKAPAAPPVVVAPAPLEVQEDHHDDPPEKPASPAARRPAFLVCNNCHREGHNAGNCPRPLLCRACGGEGHKRKDCPNPDRARLALLTAGPGRVPTCFRCGLEGHRITECKQRPVCYGCGQPGHHHNDCPINPPERPAPRIPRARRLDADAEPLEPLELDRILARLNSRPVE